MHDNFKIKSERQERAVRFDITINELEIDGKDMEYSYINIPAGVCVMPIYKGRIVCIRQYRFPIRSWEYEFPGGFIDEGEEPCAAAARELAEETGLAAREIIELGYMYPSFGSTNERIYLFAAVCEEKGETQRELGELIDMHELEESEFNELVKQGKFSHGAGLAAWARYKSGAAQSIKNTNNE